MDNKTLAVIAVVVIVIAGVGIGIAVLNNNNDGGEHKRGGNDYSLLDPKNIKEGLTITYTGTPYYGEFSETVVVTSVENGNVGFSDTIYSKDYEYVRNGMTPETFSPSSFEFDYTGTTLPQGVDVKKDGNVYTINGTFDKTSYMYKYRYSYTDLKITYNGTVTDVSGIRAAVYEYDGTVIDITNDIKMVDGQILAKATSHIDEEDNVTVAEFYDGWGPYVFDEEDYKGATITSEDGKYDEVNVKIYTVNGKVVQEYRELVYDNYKVYVYNGYTLHNEGKINGHDEDITMSIYVA